MTQTKTLINLAHISDPGKTPQAIMKRSTGCHGWKQKRGAAYNVWYIEFRYQTEQSGSIACWKEGLILAMQVCEASFVTQDSLQAAFTECSALLRIEPKDAQLNNASAVQLKGWMKSSLKSESSIRRLADAMAKERIRCDIFLATWYQLLAWWLTGTTCRVRLSVSSTVLSRPKCSMISSAKCSIRLRFLTLNKRCGHARLNIRYFPIPVGRVCVQSAARFNVEISTSRFCTAWPSGLLKKLKASKFAQSKLSQLSV